MSRRLPVALVLASFLAAAIAWVAWTPSGDDQAGTAAVARRGPRADANGAAGHASVAGASVSSHAVPAAGVRPVARKPNVFDEFVVAKDYRALYDRLMDTPEGQTAAGRLVLFEILRSCANVTGGAPAPVWRPNRPKREDFIAGIPPNDPQRERRIAAFDGFTADKCGTLASVTIAQADVVTLLNDAAAAGDPHAKALALEHELWAARRTSGGWGRDTNVSLSDAQVATLKDIASTRDPEAIRVAGRILSNSWHDYALRVGPDELPVEPRPFVNAWLVLACEYGEPCGNDTPRMQQACAFQGHCDAQGFPDYVSYYQSSPHDSQLLMQYRGLIRDAIETGNWSQIQVVRGQAPASNRMTFVPGPR